MLFLPQDIINSSTGAANLFLENHTYGDIFVLGLTFVCGVGHSRSVSHVRYYLPDGFASRVPNPDTHLRNQPGCCNGVHGYFEIVSTCACNGQGEHGCKSPLTCLPATSLASSSSPFNEEAGRPLMLASVVAGPDPRDIGGLMYATAYVHLSNASLGCHLDVGGDVAVMIPLQSTGGVCTLLGPDVRTALFGNIGPTDYGYNISYSLLMLPGQQIDLNLLCDDYPNCNSCVHRVPIHSRYSLLERWGGLCQVKPTSAVYLQEKSSSPCLGVTGQATNPSSMYLAQYAHSSTCTPTADVVVVSVLTNIGAYKNDPAQPLPCNMVPTTLNGKSRGFAVVGSAGSESYQLNAFCDAGCTSATCASSTSITGKLSSSAPPAWSCIIKSTVDQTSSGRLWYGKEIPVCALNARTDDSRTFSPLVVVILVVVAVALIAILFYLQHKHSTFINAQPYWLSFALCLLGSATWAGKTCAVP